MNRLLACLLMLVLLSCQADAALTIVGHSPTVAAYDVELDSGFAYVATQFGLCIVDLATLALQTCISTPAAYGVALDSGYAYEASDDGLFKIYLASSMVVDFCISPSSARGVTTGGGFAYVATDLGLQRINLTTFASAGFIGTSPAKAVALDGGYAYVATDAGLLKINLASLAIAGSVGTPPAKDVTIGGGYAYVATDGGVYKIDLAAFSLSTSFPMFPNAKAIALDGSYAYVATDVGIHKFCLSPFGIVGLYPITQARGVTVNGGFIYVAANDGLFKLADINCIEGYKLDTLGMGLSGWTIFIDRDGDRILDLGEPSVITDSSGHWKICGLDSFAPANVSEVAQPGWEPYLPSEGWQIISVLPNNGSININFTNQMLLCISGYKKDNCTGEGLKGWNITLTNGSYTSSKWTDQDGRYQFCGLTPGLYTVREKVKKGWTAVTPSVLKLELNCTNLTGQNFSNVHSLCISGFKLDNCTGEGLESWNVTISNVS